jgi:hypothetical protein
MNSFKEIDQGKSARSQGIIGKDLRMEIQKNHRDGLTQSSSRLKVVNDSGLDSEGRNQKRKFISLRNRQQKLIKEDLDGGKDFTDELEMDVGSVNNDAVSEPRAENESLRQSSIQFGQESQLREIEVRFNEA